MASKLALLFLLAVIYVSLVAILDHPSTTFQVARARKMPDLQVEAELAGTVAEKREAVQFQSQRPDNAKINSHDDPGEDVTKPFGTFISQANTDNTDYPNANTNHHPACDVVCLRGFVDFSDCTCKLI